MVSRSAPISFETRLAEEPGRSSKVTHTWRSSAPTEAIVGAGHHRKDLYKGLHLELTTLDSSRPTSAFADAQSCHGMMTARRCPSSVDSAAGGRYGRLSSAWKEELRLTVLLNGKTIIDDAELEGITGGAPNPFEDEPGPLMLHGDHGKVRSATSS